MSVPAAALQVGGGWLGLTPLPGRGGDLGADLDALRHWGAVVVISLTEPHEMDSAALSEGLRARGIGWMHMPVRDYGIPADAQAAPVLDVLSRHLAQGDRIVAHCMGGCGRSGALALRLMVMGGEDPDAALARLRASRPCAVETEQQRLWATGQGAGV